jgi:hypothetical protein
MMFDRGRNDRTGHEPRKLFNLCQFMCLDRDGDGSISTEECMEMIMHRYQTRAQKRTQNIHTRVSYSIYTRVNIYLFMYVYVKHGFLSFASFSIGMDVESWKRCSDRTRRSAKSHSLTFCSRFNL